MVQRFIIGLSSGSSMQGVDAALVSVKGIGGEISLQLLHFLHALYPKELRNLLIRTVASGEQSLRHACVLHRILGETYTNAVRRLAEEAKVSFSQIHCVGMSGQTLCHETDSRYPSTLSLGMPGVVAERTGLTTFSDFRTRDVVLGGQGFPLTPIIDSQMFQKRGEHRVLIHLGGVATVLSLPDLPDWKSLVAFQAAPCGFLLDGFMEMLTHGKELFDAGGKHAVQGCCIEPLLERWLTHPLLLRRPPKTIDRQDFAGEFLEQALQQAKKLNRNLHDLLCTATHFVARSILDAIHRFLPEKPHRILISGGGAKNGFLWHLLEQNLGPIPVEKIDAYGLPAESRKAVAFAGLAALTLDGIPINLPAATGASGSRLLGNITPGSQPNWAKCLQWMSSQIPVLQKRVA